VNHKIDAAMAQALYIVTEDDLLEIWLQLVGYTTRMIEKVQLKTNRQRFAGLSGSSPIACAQIWVGNLAL